MKHPRIGQDIGLMPHRLNSTMLRVMRLAVTMLSAAGVATTTLADPAIVINEFKNGSPDAIELLVVSNRVNLQGVIVKDFSNNGSGDGGGGYSFAAVPLWAEVQAGTLIVLRHDGSAADVSAGGSDYNLDVGLTNTAYFTREAASFDIAGTEIVQIKAAGSGRAGTTGAIHTFATTAATALYFTNSLPPRLRAASASSGSGLAVAAGNTTETLADFDGTDATGGLATDTLGTWNNAHNQAFIQSLRTGGGAPSNQPPTLFASVVDVSVELSNSVSFTVGARDPVDGDAITLWATNLPAGATFDTTAGVASVSNTFAWAAAEPQGNTVITFYAADKDGTNSQAITITVTPPGIASELILSEYGHSTANNKYIELFNGMGGSADLSPYSIRRFLPATTNWSTPLLLSGTLAPNRAYAIVYAAAASTVLKSKASLLTSSDAINFGGSSAVQLLKDGVPLDTVGPLDATSWGNNRVLIRKPAIVTPTTNYVAAEWDQFAATFWDNLGRHSMDGLPPQSGFPGTVQAIDDQTVTISHRLVFNVSASDPVDGDLLTLSASGLPAGATFPTTQGVGSVIGTFTWSSATPLGVYTSRFAVVDPNGTNTADAIIRVVPHFPTNQSIVVHFNEVRYNDSGDTNYPSTPDNKEFVELVAYAGTNLQGCVLRHYSGSAGTDGALWSFTFPSFVVPDDGVTDTNGHALGFVVLAQADGLIAPIADFLLPSIGTTFPRPSMQNNTQGLILFDPAGFALDAVAWGTSNARGDTGDLLTDDPGPSVITQSGDPTSPHYLHQIAYSSDDNTPAAPNNVIGDAGSGWYALAASPGTLNNPPFQSSGLLILAPPPPPPPPTGLVMILR